MTTLTTTLRSTDRRFGSFGALVSQTLAAIRDGRRMLARYDALSRLPDSELARMGIRRQDIPQAVARGL